MDTFAEYIAFKPSRMKKLILAGLLATSVHAYASQFFVVIPFPGKTTSVDPDISVALAGYALPDALVGQPYAGFDFKSLLSVTGDARYTGAGVRWRVGSGSLPAGLRLNADGTLSGTPTASGKSSFELMASYATKAGQQTYQIIVANITVSLAAGAPPQAIVGQVFGYDLKPLLSVTGDRAYPGGGTGVTWSTVSSTLPAGLYLTSDGWIGGTPSTVGAGTLTARATYRGVNGQQTYQVVTLGIQVRLASGTPPQGIAGQPYTYDVAPLLTVSGDPAYPGPGQVTWSVVSGSLPSGLSLSPAGVISGTPTAAANTSVTLQAAYRGVTGQQTYQVVTLAIAVGLAAGTPPQAIVGQAFGYDLKPSLTVTGDNAYPGGGTGVTWSTVSSTLPAGLYLTSDGWIGGTPTASGSGSLVARATYRGVNGQQTYQVVTLAISVTLAPATPAPGIVGQAYSYDVKPLLTVTGDPAYTGPGQVTWSVVSGSFPEGMVLGVDGVIRGTPTAAASGSITLQATYRGVNGPQTYQVVTLAINVTLSAGAPPQAIVGKAYGYDLKALLSVTGDSTYGGNGAGVTWTALSSTLPAGLSLTGDGRIAGTPTGSGTGSVTARATYRGIAGQQAYQVSGVAESGTMSATALTLPTTHNGDNSAAQTLTLTNTGPVPLDVSVPVVGGDFSATSTCPAALGVNASCTESIVFAPRTGGTRTGTLTIPTGAGNKVVSLSGYAQTYQYVSSGYWQSVPVTTQVECDWHNAVSSSESGGNLCGTPPNTYSHPTDTWTSTWYNCHGAAMQVDSWSCPCGGCPGNGGETSVQYENVTSYTQQWVDTSYYAWE
jgi:hypothetical protein